MKIPKLEAVAERIHNAYLELDGAPRSPEYNLCVLKAGLVEIAIEAKSEGAQVERAVILEKLNNTQNLFRNQAMQRIANHLISGNQADEGKDGE